jgi:two-component sensor histidine kinase
MDIYERKWNFKVGLLIIAFVIAGATLYYTNILASQIADSELEQVEFWAAAIERKAQLVNSANELFETIASEERKRAKLWGDATKLVLKVDEGDSRTLSFLSELIQSNTTIPVIITDENLKISFIRNIEYPGIEDSIYLRGDLLNAFSDYQPLIIDIPTGNQQFVYYQDSRIFKSLKDILNDLVESFFSEVVLNSASVPVIMVDGDGRILEYGNIDPMEEDLNQLLEEMKTINPPIRVDLGDGVDRLIYYQNSPLLNQLKFYPYIQLGIIFIFLVISYMAFSNSRRAEQNRVWVGMSKETAHQLGTPISSLSAWMEVLKESPPESWNEMNAVEEIEKDVNRLALVADRFSKIGSKPVLVEKNVLENLEQNLAYIRSRSSLKVHYDLKVEPQDLQMQINPQLFDWVIENLLKNALDAMEGDGSISIEAGINDNRVFIDISDTGKGIERSKWSRIFQPGYSTKTRGWGLGLSLSKRIIENYHKGKIFVKSSTMGEGTTFRILLPRKEG